MMTVNANTRINTERGPAVVGAWVQVQALKQSDGSLLAVEIEDVLAIRKAPNYPPYCKYARPPGQCAASP